MGRVVVTRRLRAAGRVRCDHRAKPKPCLRYSANRPPAEAADAIELLVRQGSDRALCRVNALDFAAKRALDEEQTIAAFLHAARLGLFELTWNVLCPGCGGVLETGATLKSVKHEEYTCALCAAVTSLRSTRWSK